MPDEPVPRRLRNTARGIVIRDGKILLMERWRPGMHYFSIPGGGIEPGEAPEETVLREITEETTITVKVERQVLEMRDSGFAHKIYLCDYVSGEPHLPDDSPEAQQHGEDNRFKPGWQPISDLPELPFVYWKPLQYALVDGLKNGFPEKVQIVSAS
ncbi:MAG TPA: NUDIX domain-containing protein [Candidatus Saccharimonadales bacterium]|nr:NUDIX domain-containing protein [Candidatus Saccharimonadales bacterium]